MNRQNFPVIQYKRDFLSIEDMQRMSHEILKNYDTRRSVRTFSDKPIPDSVLENIIMAASTAPSGANKQPWTFCVITNAELKKEIRIAAEKEEFDSYNGRMPEEWLNDLAKLGTDWHKPFLEIAPALIIVFKRSFEFGENHQKKNNYYVTESVGLACGFLLTAIHQCGLVALTHTPSPMQFLSKILQRPENEKPFLLIPVGYPSDDCEVPDIGRKSLENISQWYK